jgi:TetR/AcrR family transcriptional regulator, cholesterol catabolism regulator
MDNENKKSTKKIADIAKIGAQLFSTKGFVETSMDNIAVAAKLSKGGLYHYFSSKTELLDYIVQTFMDIVLKDLELELGNAGKGLEKIKALIFRHVQTYLKHTSEAKTLLNEAHNLPSKARKKIIVKEREYLRITTGVVSDYFGPSPGKGEAATIAFSLLGMCNWIYSWYSPKGPIGPEKLSSMIFDLFTVGISGVREKYGNGPTT